MYSRDMTMDHPKKNDFTFIEGRVTYSTGYTKEQGIRNEISEKQSGSPRIFKMQSIAILHMKQI